MKSTSIIFSFLLLIISMKMSIALASDLDLTIQNLSKKWVLKEYRVLFYSEAPDQKEKGDYLHLQPDMTFKSITEGEYEEGNWKLDSAKKQIILTKKGVTGKLIFIVEELSQDKLVMTIHDPNDSEAQYLKIHFQAN